MIFLRALRGESLTYPVYPVHPVKSLTFRVYQKVSFVPFGSFVVKKGLSVFICVNIVPVGYLWLDPHAPIH